MCTTDPPAATPAAVASRLFMGTRDPDPTNWAAPTVAEIQDTARRITGLTLRLSHGEFGWRVRFQNFLADSYRRGCAFLVGDAAHVWPPVSAQGMSTGIQDGVNLGWKLAAALDGRHTPPPVPTCCCARSCPRRRAP